MQLPLIELRDEYRRDLFDDFLPFMDRYVIDHELGGFMCHCDRDGTRLSGEKDSWYEGRGIWVYSYLYQHFGRDPRHLEVARKDVDFILGIAPREGSLWPRKFTREGETTVPDTEIYGTAFIAEGLAEYAAASGDMSYWERAKSILLGCVRFAEAPDYQPDMSVYFLDRPADPFPFARPLGVSMLTIRIGTQMLRTRPDEEIEAAVRSAVDIVMKCHYNAALDLNNELINRDCTRPANAYSQFVFTGHSCETMWMIMDEALRRGDRALFELAAARFRRHLEVGWDDVYGGLYRGVANVDRNDWFLDKVLWAQEEVLIGTLLLWEHAASDWAAEWFLKTYNYVKEKYPLRKHGLPLWITVADRKVSFEPHFNRIENFHHPRHLMLNLQALERLLGRANAVSA